MFRNLNHKLIIIVTVLLIIGELVIYSAANVGPDGISVVAKQGLWMLLGISIAIFIIIIGYKRLLEAAYPLYILIIIMLLAVVVVGERHLGAQRWLSIGFLNVQPSELAKFVFILALARFFGFDRKRINQIGSLLIALVMFAFVFVPILKQPDLGTALSFVPILFSILFVAGLSIKYIAAMVSTGILGVPVLWGMLKDYQKKRLLVFLNPNIDPLGAGYTIIQSKIAIGSGGLFGKGYLMGTQSQLKFLPESHTDFIFSVFSEEWGFAGVLFVLLLHLFLVVEAFNISHKSKSNCAKLLSSGIAVMFAFHFLINVSMISGLVPVVGLPLPFMSYGGSNLIVSLAAIGVLLSIDRERVF
ncbi:MAG: rod shape-determining protein RodA [Candidatus Omnitrophota bacterium]